MQTAPPPDLTFRSPDWIKLMAQGQHEALSRDFLRILGALQVLQLGENNPQNQYFVNHLVKTFLSLFTEVEFKVPDAHIGQYIGYNQLIMNLAAISAFRTTDPFLQNVLPQEGNFAKILTLFNARCTTKIDRKMLFDFHPEMASLWYASYSCGYYGALQSQAGYENLREHFAFTHPRLSVRHQIQEAYFGSTYAGGNLDQIIKPVVNRSAREMIAGMGVIHNQPKRNKVALISGLWLAGTSVHRNYSEFIRGLKSEFHLTFIAMADPAASDLSMFDEIRVIRSENGAINLNALQNNDFQAVIFPDIGMIDISILLANLRIAPIQIAFLGHSVSTFGAKVDYFISGADVEIPDRPERNYSERLVLLPGMGVTHNVPMYQLRGLKRDNEVLIINGLFWCQKVNYPFVQTLKKLIARAGRRIKIRIFPGNSAGRSNDRLPFVQDLTTHLGAENVEVLPAMDYQNYMALVEQGDLTIDSFPFGGCNTVSDSLYAHVPCVTWASDKWYGRIGSEMLRLAGLAECAATTEEEFLDITLRLIQDDAYRAAIRAKVQAADLPNTIYDKRDARYFAKALNYCIDHHAQLQADGSREPIRIERD